jgi:hypothetical protein
MKRTDAAALAVVAIGCVSMVGFAVGSKSLRGVGAMTAASPLPLVFSQFRGLETFAARFSAELERTDGSTRRFEITPAMYAELDGPYNRRNAYGAVIAFGPVLTEPNERAMVTSVLRHGLCDLGPLAVRFGETVPALRVRVTVETLTRGAESTWSNTVECR